MLYNLNTNTQSFYKFYIEHITRVGAEIAIQSQQ